MKIVIFGILGVIVLCSLCFCQGLNNGCVVSSLPVIDVWQSSTYQGTFLQSLIAVFNGYNPFSAQNAVDGEIVSGSISGSCTQTVIEEDPWWQVQLDRSYQITSLTITTPEVCKTCPTDFKLNNILVEVADVMDSYGDAGWQVVWDAQKQNCSYISYEIQSGESVVVNCSTPVFGNYIRISNHGRYEQTLSLCEIVVFGFSNCTLPEGEIVASLTTSENKLPFIPTTCPYVGIARIRSAEESKLPTSMDVNYFKFSPSNLLDETLNMMPVLVKSTNEAGVSASVSVPETESTTSGKKLFLTSKPVLASWISSRFSVSSSETLSTKDVFILTVSSTTPISYQSQFTSSSDILTSEVLKSTKYSQINLYSRTIKSSKAITMSSIVPVWCPCTCEQAKLIAGLTGTNKTTQEVEQEIQKALIELTIDSKTTTANERKLVSAEDKRDSAKVVGTIGVVFCSVILTLIILSDLPVLIRAIIGFLPLSK